MCIWPWGARICEKRSFPNPNQLTLFHVDNAPADNNRVENAIRPFVVGRKNGMFAGSPDGASASACFFSLIETAKANGLEPYGYLIFSKSCRMHKPTRI